MKEREQILLNLKEHTIIAGGAEEDDGIAVQLDFGGLRKSLRVIASWGEGWDHVSVSRSDMCPSWEQMCFVKDFFFHSSECVIQYHPPEKSYVNNHQFCLHLWRPQNQEIPIPPINFV